MEKQQKSNQDDVPMIEEYREKNGEPPEGMMVLYDYLHGKHIEKAKMVKVMQGMYRE